MPLWLKEMFMALIVCPACSEKLETPEGCTYIKQCPANHGMFSLHEEKPFIRYT